MYPKIFVTLKEIAVYCLLALRHRLIVTTVYDGSCHAAENGLDGVKKLGTRREWRYGNNGSSIGKFDRDLPDSSKLVAQLPNLAVSVKINHLDHLNIVGNR